MLICFNLCSWPGRRREQSVAFFLTPFLSIQEMTCPVLSCPELLRQAVNLRCFSYVLPCIGGMKTNYLEAICSPKSLYMCLVSPWLSILSSQTLGEAPPALRRAEILQSPSPSPIVPPPPPPLPLILSAEPVDPPGCVTLGRLNSLGLKRDTNYVIMMWLTWKVCRY